VSTAIAGIGATEFSKRSGRSELRLAAEAVLAALDDAGLSPGDVDGLVTYSQDANQEIAVARETGIGELTFFSRVRLAEAGLTGQPSSQGLEMSWHVPFGLMTPAAWVAMFARRYMHVYDATSADFGRVAVAMRRHAATNPAAWFHGRPITLEEHQASRWIVEPLHLLDCCQESDGAVALVVTSTERARDLRRSPAVIAAAAQGAGADQMMMTSYYRDDMTGLPEMSVVGRRLWELSGLSPADIQTAILYDHFTPFVLTQLEELGFCGRGEAPGFLADGGIELDGRLPVNPHGGQLGEAYIHGMNGIAEAVRQIRGTAVNQLPNVTNVLVTAGTGVPTSGLILSAG
jgi:acetyl-CoA acetyltransferase